MTIKKKRKKRRENKEINRWKIKLREDETNSKVKFHKPGVGRAPQIKGEANSPKEDPHAQPKDRRDVKNQEIIIEKRCK